MHMKRAVLSGKSLRQPFSYKMATVGFGTFSHIAEQGTFKGCEAMTEYETKRDGSKRRLKSFALTMGLFKIHKPWCPPCRDLRVIQELG
jgi:hypothetical protein